MSLLLIFVGADSHPPLQLVLQIFENRCGAHAAADAHGHHAILGFAATHFVDQLCGELGPGAAQRMTEGDRAAIDVDLVLIQLQLCGSQPGTARQRLHSILSNQYRSG